MFIKGRSHHDFCGHVESVHTVHEDVDCGGGRKRRPNADCGRERCDCDCDRDRKRTDICPPRPTGWEIFIQILVKIICVVMIIVVGVLAYWYGYEKGYWKGYWKGIEDGGVGPPPPVLEEGGPCRRTVDGRCAEAKDAQSAIQYSRYYLKLGDASSALQDWPSALQHYRNSMRIGSSVGAQSANYAARRIQYQSMTCEYDDESLSRIARDHEKNVLGAPIHMKQKQQALAALGYYNGKVDNQHGPGTREAIRDFQGDLWFDQNGVLSAEQTVILVCGGAQIAKDIGSQNVLGIMYASGLGVRQNTDFALDWLESAAQRGDADASWNLALMYGTQTVLSSVQICDAVQNAERADSYLYEAAKAGHPAAKRTKAKYAHYSPEKRWSLIAGDINQPEALRRVGRGCNPNG